MASITLQSSWEAHTFSTDIRNNQYIFKIVDISHVSLWELKAQIGTLKSYFGENQMYWDSYKTRCQLQPPSPQVTNQNPDSSPLELFSKLFGVNAQHKNCHLNTNLTERKFGAVEYVKSWLTAFDKRYNHREPNLLYTRKVSVFWNLSDTPYDPLLVIYALLRFSPLKQCFLQAGHQENYSRSAFLNHL